MVPVSLRHAGVNLADVVSQLFQFVELVGFLRDFCRNTARSFLSIQERDYNICRLGTKYGTLEVRVGAFGFIALFFTTESLALKVSRMHIKRESREVNFLL